MHTNPSEKPDPDLLREMGYERRDVQMKKLSRYVIGFFVFTFASFFISWAFLQVFHPDVLTVKPVPVRKVTPPVDSGILQSNRTTKIDIQKLRQDERKMLSEYAFAKPDQTAVRVPIEKAMEIVAAQGLPKVNTQVPAITKGNTITQNALPQPDPVPPTPN